MPVCCSPGSAPRWSSSNRRKAAPAAGSARSSRTARGRSARSISGPTTATKNRWCSISAKRKGASICCGCLPAPMCCSTPAPAGSTRRWASIAKRWARGFRDRKSTRLNSSHTVIYTLSLHDALPIYLLRLLAGADVLLDASAGGVNAALGLDREALGARFPQLVTARLTPFGDDGPWAFFKGSDLVHLALGGVMMNCGYDPDPRLEYDTPPIAPQAWHAYHIAGEQLATGILAALIHRHRSGEGQDVSLAVHEAVAKNPELDIMHWVMRRVPLWRLTNRHAAEIPNHSPGICHTKDGRWFITHGMGARDLKNLVPLLAKYGMQADLELPPPEADLRARQVPGSAAGNAARAHMLDIVQRFVRAWTYADMPWREAQAAGLLWAPLRKPHENALDAHWLARHTFSDIPHPELGRRFRYPTSKWLSSRTTWQVGRRPPLLGEDSAAILGEAARRPAVPATPRQVAKPLLSALHNKPFPLQGVRILDFAWFLASAGGTRFLAAMGA